MKSEEARALRDRILYDVGSSYPDWRIQMDSYPDAAYGPDGVEDSYFVTVVTDSQVDAEVRSWDEWLDIKQAGGVV